MKTIQQQTGWNRPHPQTICQEMDALVSVTDYSFDLGDKGFFAYCKARGVAHKAGHGKRFSFTADHAKTREDFGAMFGVSETGWVYSPEDMETHWRIMLAAKGSMQDCWELYTSR